MRSSPKQLIEFGPFRLDPDERLLWRDREVVPLAAKVFETLWLLVQHGGQLLTKDELMQAIWPDSFVEEGSLPRNVSTLRKALGERPGEHQYIDTVPGRGYRFVAAVNAGRGDRPLAIPSRGAQPPSPPARSAEPRETVEPVGGAVPLDSAFYIERPADQEFRAAVARRDSVVLVKGARQVGKTSLLARSLHRARQSGARVVFTDLQTLDPATLASPETFFVTLAGALADQLETGNAPDRLWQPRSSPSVNFERYLRREVLGTLSVPLVWGLDEVDRLFHTDFGSSVFGLFRSWHNARALDPEGPWQQLTLAIAYATEAHLFITEPYQSPFNVGTRLQLEDFTIEQVAEIDRRYGSPLGDAAAIERYGGLVGGHPYLVRCGLHAMTTGRKDLAGLEAAADRDEGVFGEHLRRLLLSLTHDPGICEVMRGVLRGQGCPTAESFYRLRSGGVIVGETPQEARPRCRVYAAYLTRHLL